MPQTVRRLELQTYIQKFLVLIHQQGLSYDYPYGDVLRTLSNKDLEELARLLKELADQHPG